MKFTDRFGSKHVAPVFLARNVCSKPLQLTWSQLPKTVLQITKGSIQYHTFAQSRNFNVERERIVHFQRYDGNLGYWQAPEEKEGTFYRRDHLYKFVPIEALVAL